MPGITGIISKKSREKNREYVRLMNRFMMHEPFYKSGTYFNDQFGLFAGWICQENSFSDCMPVQNESGDLVLIFSGENFADQEVIRELKNRGHDFEDSTASYLIHLYEEDEKGFLEKLNGWFSGVLLDLRKGEIILFNDRYGMGRIYFYEGEEEFIFSSEAKCLLLVKPKLREMDPKGLGELFGFGCVLQNRTLFKGIFTLPAGAEWKFVSGGRVKKDRYFKATEWEDQPILERETFYRKVKGTLAKSLPRYFDAKDGIGLSLTGGLDTRIILAHGNKPEVPFPCYTFGSKEADVLDVRIARKIAAACHQTHRVLKIDQGFFSEFPSLAEKTIYITDGCNDVCGSHEIFLNRLARKIAPIRMTGNYGGEVLRGVSTFKALSLPEDLFHPDFKLYLKEAGTTFDGIKRGNRLSFAVSKEVPWHLYGLLASAQSQLTVRTPYMDNDFIRLVYQAPDDARTNMELSLRLIEDACPGFLEIRTDQGVGGRSNFFFSTAVRWLYRLLSKMEWYYNDGLPHWLAKIDSLLAPLHPERLLFGHHKYLHYRLWFRDVFPDYLRQTLLDPRTVTRPYLNKHFLEEMVNNHINGKGNYTNEINWTLTSELVQRLLIENTMKSCSHLSTDG